MPNSKRSPRTSTTSLSEPWTSHDKILIWFYRTPSELISYHKFGALYSARKFVEAAIGIYETKWKNKNELLVRGDWLVFITDPKSSHTLEDIMEHEYSDAEEEWELPVPYPEYARKINQYHFGVHPDVSSRARAAQGKPPLSEEEMIAAGLNRNPNLIVKPEPEPKRAETKRERGQRAPRKREGVTLAEICAPLKIDPHDARAALRSAKTKKPDAGWVWPSAKDAPDIKKLVEKHCK
jgi:hypothetical protein